MIASCIITGHPPLGTEPAGSDTNAQRELFCTDVPLNSSGTSMQYSSCGMLACTCARKGTGQRCTHEWRKDRRLALIGKSVERRTFQPGTISSAADAAVTAVASRERRVIIGDRFSFFLTTQRAAASSKNATMYCLVSDSHVDGTRPLRAGFRSAGGAAPVRPAALRRGRKASSDRIRQKTTNRRQTALSVSLALKRSQSLSD